MSAIGLWDVVHDLGLALGGAFVGGFYAIRVANLSNVEERAAEYRKRRRDCLEKIATDFIEVSEACLETGHIHICLADARYSDAEKRTMAERLEGLIDPIKALVTLRRLRALAMIFNEAALANELSEFIAIDCAMAEAIGKGCYPSARHKHQELHGKIPGVLAVASTAHRLD